MKIHELIITRKLLLHLKSLHQNERLLPIPDAFQNLLTREDLLAIIEHMTEGLRHEDDPDFLLLTDRELLKYIADQYYILDYLIFQIEREVGI